MAETLDAKIEKEVERVKAIAIALHKQFKATPINASRMANSRRGIQARRYSVLNDDCVAVVDSELQVRFSDLDNIVSLRKFIDYSNNVYSAVINRLAQVYKTSPRRWFRSSDKNAAQQDTELFHALVDDDYLDARMSQVNRIALALNECFIRPRLVAGEMHFDILSPHQVEVMSDGTHLLALAYETAQKGVYAIWTDSFIAQLTEVDRGDVAVEVSLNPYRIIPFVVYRKDEPVTGYWLGMQGQDLYDAYVDQTIGRSWLNRVFHFQSYKQLYREGMESSTLSHGVSASDDRPGPDAVLEGKYGLLDLQTNLLEFFKVLEGKQARVAHNWGLEPDSLSTTTQPGNARFLSYAALLDARKAQIKHFRRSDKALMKMIALVANAELDAGFSLRTEPEIDYAEPIYIDEPRYRLEFEEKAISMGMLSMAEALMRHNPDIATIDEAMERLEENFVQWAKFSEFKRSFSLPNSLTDNPGPDPREAGKLGGRPPTDPATKTPEERIAKGE